MKLEIVNFKQAKALKELGFPQEDESYNEYTYIYLDNAVNFQDNHKCIKELMQIKDFYNGAFDSWDMYVAPTLELTAKWLREEKKIYVIAVPLVPEYAYDDGNYKFHYVLVQQQKVPIRERGFETWEQALSAGIDKAIEILTKEE